DLSGDRSGCAGTLNTHVGAALRGRPSLDIRCVGEPPRGGHRGPPLHDLSGDRSGCAGTLNTHVEATCRGGPPWPPLFGCTLCRGTTEGRPQRAAPTWPFRRSHRLCWNAEYTCRGDM